MAEERGIEVVAGGWGGGSGIEMSRLNATLANAAQRARLLVNGIAGPLSERQRALASDILRDVEMLCEAAGAASAHLRVEPETFSLASVVADVVGSFRFVAHRKQLALTLLGAHGVTDCVADLSIVRQALSQTINAAVAATPSGARVSVEVSRSGDRFAVDISAPGWDPRLPPSPPTGSGVAVSVMRTSAGARLVLSVPAATL